MTIKLGEIRDGRCGCTWGAYRASTLLAAHLRGPRPYDSSFLPSLGPTGLTIRELPPFVFDEPQPVIGASTHGELAGHGVQLAMNPAG